MIKKWNHFHVFKFVRKANSLLIERFSYSLLTMCYLLSDNFGYHFFLLKVSEDYFLFKWVLTSNLDLS